jgi:hypothetical protein
MKAPLFIFSLPRSGSTLLQRVLMAHKDIHSTAEPWMLLPQIYMLKKRGSLSEYSNYTANAGILDFIENLPHKEADYNNALRGFMLELYSKQCKNNEVYFLDKTPRYYLIIDDIVKLFPNAKLIFLFRNPVHVFASIVNTWGNKRFNKLFSTYEDIILGTPRLSHAYVKHKDKSIALRYEDFVTNTSNEIKKIFEYLQLDYDQDVATKFNRQDTKGSLGDLTGVKKYSKISSDGLNKWECTFNSIVRKRFAIRLIKKLGKDNLETQGYDKETIIKAIKALNNKHNTQIFKDIFDYFTSFIIRKFKLYLFINKDFSWIKKRYVS